jgi:hypothetical protein
MQTYMYIKIATKKTLYVHPIKIATKQNLHVHPIIKIATKNSPLFMLVSESSRL